MTEGATQLLVEYRLEQAQSALRDGQILIETGGSVSGIINRAYYAMFYAALALMEIIGKTPSKHAGVITLFDTEFVLPGVFPKDMSKAFHRLFELRQTSDYKVTEKPDLTKAKEVYSQAVLFVAEVESFFKAKGLGPKENNK